MNIFIDNRSKTAIYDQIYSQIKNHIISGAIKENSSLPSIRNLAKDLHISVITTKRAYDELEREGFIYTVQGKGCFVAQRNVEWIREENLRTIEGYIEKIAAIASSCNLNADDIADMIRIVMGDRNECN